MGAITVGILSPSGWGKTTSMIVDKTTGKVELNADGSLNLVNAMNPETTFYINADRKRLPFPKSHTLYVAGKNMLESSKQKDITELLEKINKGTKYKSVIIDTVNAIMVDYEMEERKKLTFDNWMDLAREVYSIIQYSNSMRDDIVIYFLGHVALYTDVDGNESKCLVTNGRKLDKIRLESKLPLVLFGHVARENDVNTYHFETQSNRSTGKTPVGMFPKLRISNSLRAVDDAIREYYGIK